MTAPMYLSEVSVTGLDMDSPHFVLSMMDGKQYKQHQWLWHLFQSETERKFLYREKTGAQQTSPGVYQRSNLPSFYVLSTVAPQAHLKYVTVKTKSFSPSLSKGRRLFFHLRANPVVRKKRDGYKHSQKCDVLMDAKRQVSGSEPAWPAMEASAKSWLVAQGEKKGFAPDLNSLAVQQYQQHLLPKKGAPKPITFSSVDYQGLLAVTDPELFVAELGKGFGSAKAFGCGLMLIRRA
ncbi:type I-E CRISPR-associated protein Cas6/Cse3/CasE [Exilibacterium tricleocarpae]|uniref:Type I-E CRISPR-associated protein Cas6/Cse3/CasE n=1 Tax=Exilibacterium tricleocarpae TaxID=2591008 RepID=A0A545TZ07_9GAMM|nr:type I-E CRISPR-associated protein Cas6/Cse3/CasE [Exilibacterium tricleocarpae]TQV82459.1 type I-E CRISPR-associated protein Cas6/Cse3/CasE [Exilibacterium tricleocarpae]